MEADIARVEVQLGAIKHDIKAAQAERAPDWHGRAAQLRDKEAQLCNEKAQLRSEEVQLREEKKPLLSMLLA